MCQYICLLLQDLLRFVYLFEAEAEIAASLVQFLCTTAWFYPQFASSERQEILDNILPVFFLHWL